MLKFARSGLNMSRIIQALLAESCYFGIAAQSGCVRFEPSFGISNLVLSGLPILTTFLPETERLSQDAADLVR